MMRYCFHHARGYLAAGDRRSPGSWHPLSPSIVALALGIARASGCAGQIQVQEAQCDLCEEEHTLGNTASLTVSQRGEERHALGR
jgi:hypothetical protein